MPKFFTYIITLVLLSGLSWSAEAANPQRGAKKRDQTESVQKDKKRGTLSRQRLSPSARTFFVDGNAYYYDEGYYYRRIKDKGYEEVNTPRNVVFRDLPYGSRKSYFNGYTYYDADGMWFLLVQGKFLLVEQPGANYGIQNTLPARTYEGAFGY